MARTNIKPIRKSEDTALAIRQGVCTAKDYAKAGVILVAVFGRTLFTGNVTQQPRAKPAVKRRAARQ